MEKKSPVGMICLFLAGLLALPNVISKGNVLLYLGPACFFTAAIIELVKYIKYKRAAKKKK